MSTPAPSSAADRRHDSRRRTLLRGRICYGDEASYSVDCSIKNLTPDGAMLGVPASAHVPANFTLLHVNEGVAYDARLAWRRGDLMGCALGERHDLKGVVDAQLKALRQIWVALAPV